MTDAKKPNILVIWGDDIGITNLSCYSDGLMGYRTPHIDRIATSHIGQLARGLDEAPKRGWIVVDMKQDWKAIYPHAASQN